MSKDPAPSGTTVVGHPVAFSMLRMCGVTPEAAMRKAAVWPEGYAADYVENDRGTLRMRMPLDAAGQTHVTVNGSEAILSARGQSFPDTALMGIKGLPISSIVDHVLLSNQSYVTSKVVPFDQAEEGVGTHFHIGGDPVEYVVP